MVRGHLGGHLPALGLRPADDLHRAGRRDVADVQRGPDVRGQQAVAGDDRLLGDRGPAGQAEPAGHLALVHLRAVGEPRLLGVLGDHAAEGLDVLQGPAHQHRVVTRTGRRRRRPGPGPPSRPSRPARRADCRPGPTVTAPTGWTSQRPAWRPSRQICSTTPAVSATGSVLAIACTAVKPPSAAAAVPLCDGLGVLAARLAQVGVQVDQAGQRDQAVGVQPAAPRRARRPAPISVMTPPEIRTSAGSPPSGRAPADQPGAGPGACSARALAWPVILRPPPRRAAGTARPSAR